ncbi:hypothetical protein [Pseudonocardia pini]|uniref:hypothetical protein n=1 Tax=Pseudonocardia pini TaxID=2758030 RepID=UPI0015F05112|nr:hypothetical protein [Pseudonocardia pini]
MVAARYEIRIDGTVSEGVRGAFETLEVTSVPQQTIVSGVTELQDLLALCLEMGLEVVSVRRLPAATSGLPRDR